jgi:2Fe-2S ferredoxin
MKMIAIDREGYRHSLAGRDGWTVMEILRDAGLPIVAECGGACACATCHVYVHDPWFARLPARSEFETEMLDMAVAFEANSRLSCQIICGAELEGLEITLAPD